MKNSYFYKVFSVGWELKKDKWKRIVKTPEIRKIRRKMKKYNIPHVEKKRWCLILA